MTSMLDHPSVADSEARGIYKGLHVGDSGTGKTGAIVSLIEAGYKVRILDFDAGLDPLAGYIKPNKRELLANVSYHTLKDRFQMKNGYMSVKKAPSFLRATQLLENWKDESAPDGSFGAVETWSDDTILVIDTLGSMARSSFNMVLQANGIIAPSGQRGGPEQSHYGTAQDNIERMLEWLIEPALVPCHLIINAHWTWQEGDLGTSRAYPATIGKALNPKIGQKFNNMLGFAILAGNKVIKTQKDGMISLKTSKPLAESYPIATGLADIFAAIVGPPPSAA